MKEYRVKWTVVNSKVKGCGLWLKDKAVVQAWVDEGNREWPNLRHTLEERTVEDDTRS